MAAFKFHPNPIPDQRTSVGNISEKYAVCTVAERVNMKYIKANDSAIMGIYNVVSDKYSGYINTRSIAVGIISIFLLPKISVK
jgi:hypothetical protein